MATAHVVQRPQRGEHPVGGEHRVGHHDGALLVAGRQRGLDGGDVAVRCHDDSGARQPAGVHQRRMRQRVGHHKRSRPGQRHHRTEVGGVARGEDQRRLGADEIRQRGLEAFVQFGVAGDQPRSGRACTPGAQRLDAAVDHVGVLRQAEVVVGRQVELGADRRTGAQRSAQPGGAPLLLDLVEPGQRGKTDASHLTAPSMTQCHHLNGVQVNVRATPTIAEVICSISSGVQMYGGMT